MNKIIYSIILLGFANLCYGQSIILNTDFETGIPAGYVQYNLDGFTPASAVSTFQNAWNMKIDPINSSDSVIGATSFFNPIGKANRWIVTPALTLGAFGNFLEWQARSHDQSFPDNYKVLISTTDNQVASFTDTLAIVLGETASTWSTRTVNLSAKGFNSQTVYIAFVLESYDRYVLYLDDIKVTKDDPVGVQEITKNTVKIFPNPVQQELTINSNAKINNILIYNSLGGIVLSDNGDVFSDKLNVQHLTNGVYFLHVHTENGVEILKFIKN